MWYMRSPAAVVRSTLARQRGDWRLGLRNTRDICTRCFTNRSAIAEHAWTQDNSNNMEQGKSAEPCSQSYWTGFEVGTVHLDKKLSVTWPEWRLPDARQLDLYHKEISGGAGRSHAPASGHVYPWVCGQAHSAVCIHYKAHGNIIL